MSMAAGGELTPARVVLWYGTLPDIGVRERLEQRGIRIDELGGNVGPVALGQLASATAVVFHHSVDGVEKEFAGYKNIKEFINHGLRIFIVCNPSAEERILREHLVPESNEYPWSEGVRFIPDFKGVNFDYFVHLPSRRRWRSQYNLPAMLEDLTGEERILLGRAFPNAADLKLKEITPGFSKARVFMVHEKRHDSSLSHWTQPKLVKIGRRKALLREVDAMKQVSPYVPFELRPNYEAHAAGFTKALYVADFVDKSESLLHVAHDGRAEGALSTLFFRTLGVWRDCASQRPASNESLAAAAERLGMITVGSIESAYRESSDFTERKIDLEALWAQAKEIRFDHRVATIHGDLHGENVRVRGEDAIIIDLGEIKGTGQEGAGAPLCFDAAMLDVALAFQCVNVPGKPNDLDDFKQSEWTEEIQSYYNFKSLTSGPPRSEKYLGGWLHGCLQRIRAFATYDKSDPFEYPIAVAIALWRWCKFPPVSEYRSMDRGRRVRALILGAAILRDAIEEHSIREKDTQ